MNQSCRVSISEVKVIFGANFLTFNRVPETQMGRYCPLTKMKSNAVDLDWVTYSEQISEGRRYVAK